MVSSRGKAVALWSFVAGLVLLGASLLVFRRPLLESWHIRCLGSDDVETRTDAAAWLLESGSRRATEHLLAALGDEMRALPEFARDTRVRELLDRKASAVVPRKAMVSEMARILSKATGVEIRLGASLRASLRAVEWPQDRTLTLRRLLGRGLAGMGADYNFAVVPGGILLGRRHELLGDLPSEPCGERYAELPLCRALAEAGDRALPLLGVGLAHHDPYVRAGAATALGTTAADPGELLAALVRLLEDGVVDACAAEALGRLGVRAKSAIEPLKKYLLSRYREEGARFAAATAWNRLEGLSPRKILRVRSR